MNEGELYTIVNKCIEGDRISQKMIFEMFSPKMMSLCLRYTRSKMDAEDVLQNGFVRVFTKLEQFNFKGSFEGWVRRIMVHSALRFLETKKKYVSIDAHLPIFISDELEENDSSCLNDLLRLIRRLPDGYREVFNMYVFEGFDHNEIGEVLGIAASTSRSQLTKARKLLQSEIKSKNLVK